jgi:hypothetical protein
VATVRIPFRPTDAIPASSNYPTLDVVSGTNFPVACLDFDAATEETCFLVFEALNYGSGNLTLTIEWYADTASSGDVIWGAALAAITPNSDSQDIETKAFATAQTATDTHLGTTGQRLHSVDITISNLDSIAAGDWVVLKFYRDADAAGDTMTGDACLVGAVLSYSDT